MKAWFQLIRPINLVLLMLTQYCIDWFILQPNFTTYGLHFTLNEWQFFLLVLSTTLICAGGYIINDYFDVAIDNINKPGKQIIGKTIAPQRAFYGYLLLTAVGLGLGIYLSLAIDYWKLITVFVVVIFLLYFYSATFKKTAVIGNLIVAILAAMSVIIIMLFEPALYQLARPGDYYIAGICIDYITGISFFAFALTMVREIVKDIQDMEGDRRHQAKTLPIRFGVKTAKGIATAFIVITMAALGYIYVDVLQIFGSLYLIYIVILIVFLAVIAVRLFTAATKNEYGLVSTLLKTAMFLGLGLMPFYYLLEF